MEVLPGGRGCTRFAAEPALVRPATDSATVLGGAITPPTCELRDVSRLDVHWNMSPTDASEVAIKTNLDVFYLSIGYDLSVRESQMSGSVGIGSANFLDRSHSQLTFSDRCFVWYCCRPSHVGGSVPKSPERNID